MGCVPVEGMVARHCPAMLTNLKFGLGDAELAGLRRFHELAAEISVVPELKPLTFFNES